ncbi:hypothetical protein TRVA0_049S00166 [Trichomonascus vanleenenianus]|uniref:uncharacterized protein n=1 Tax=Trichomonascus vanleenenianus TaxID=2268995 RepID=UPI003EC9D5A4
MRTIIYLAVVLFLAASCEAMSTVVDYETQLITEVFTSQVTITSCKDHGCTAAPVTVTRIGKLTTKQATASIPEQTSILTSFIPNRSEDATPTQELSSSSTAAQRPSAEIATSALTDKKGVPATSTAGPVETEPSPGRSEYSASLETKNPVRSGSTVPFESERASLSTQTTASSKTTTVIRKATTVRTLTTCDENGKTRTIYLTLTGLPTATHMPVTTTSSVLTTPHETSEVAQPEKTSSLDTASTSTKTTTALRKTLILKTLTTCNEEGKTQTIVVTETSSFGPSSTVVSAFQRTTEVTSSYITASSDENQSEGPSIYSTEGFTIKSTLISPIMSAGSVASTEPGTRASQTGMPNSAEVIRTATDAASETNDSTRRTTSAAAILTAESTSQQSDVCRPSMANQLPPMALLSSHCTNHRLQKLTATNVAQSRPNKRLLLAHLRRVFLASVMLDALSR